MKEEGIPLTHYGIRLDSGDLAYMSKKARKMLDEAGFQDAVIAASSDLDEHLIYSLKNQGGSHYLLGRGNQPDHLPDCPAFGGVYKLAAIQNEKENSSPRSSCPKIRKRSRTRAIKPSTGFYDKTTGKIRADLICLADETFDEKKDMIIFDPPGNLEKNKDPGRLLYPAGTSGSGIPRRANAYIRLPLSWRSGITVRRKRIPFGMRQSGSTIPIRYTWICPTNCLKIKACLLEQMSMDALK